MSKAETIQLFSKLIEQNLELKELLLNLQKNQSESLKRQKVLREGQEQLLKNQNIIWELLKKVV